MTNVFEVNDVVTFIDTDQRLDFVDEGSITGIFKVIDVQGPIVAGKYLNESGTYDYITADEEDIVRVV